MPLNHVFYHIQPKSQIYMRLEDAYILAAVLKCLILSVFNYHEFAYCFGVILSLDINYIRSTEKNSNCYY